jgi:hypothetical protein
VRFRSVVARVLPVAIALEERHTLSFGNLAVVGEGTRVGRIQSDAGEVREDPFLDGASVVHGIARGAAPTADLETGVTAARRLDSTPAKAKSTAPENRSGTVGMIGRGVEDKKVMARRHHKPSPRKRSLGIPQSAEATRPIFARRLLT